MSTAAITTTSRGAETPAPAITNPLNPQGLKPCCACPETKSARDACFLQHDAAEANEACKQLVREHVACMRGYGFNI